MPVPDQSLPADFAGGPVDVDQTLAHREVGLAGRHFQGVLPGQRPYPWICPNCGASHMGRMEDGCSQCGAGRDARQGQPDPAVDPICKACRGNKTVNVKCKNCQGSGEDPKGNGEYEIASCLDCGGAGTLTIDCRRCHATGLDPHPTQTGMAGIIMESGKAPQQLPSLEEPTTSPQHDQPPRYFLLEVPGHGLSVTVVEIANSPRVQAILNHTRIFPKG